MSIGRSNLLTRLKRDAAAFMLLACLLVLGNAAQPALAVAVGGPAGLAVTCLTLNDAMGGQQDRDHGECPICQAGLCHAAAPVLHDGDSATGLAAPTGDAGERLAFDTGTTAQTASKGGPLGARAPPATY